jgi:signal transduction histidine kinase
MDADARPRRARELRGLALLALDDPTETIESALDAAREGLEMEIAYLAEFTDDKQVFHNLAGDLDTLDIGQGEAMPLEDTYCQRMCDGRIGNVVTDVRSDPELAPLALTKRAGIGAYVGVPLRFSDGRLYGTFCCLSHAPNPDIGQREVRFMRVLAKIVSGEIERQELHRQADQLKDDFVALVSHELRTPLASIIANLEVLEDETEGLSDDGRRFVGVIDRNARRLLRLVGQLLFVAQLQAGRMPAERAWVDVDRVVADAVSLARAGAHAKRIDLELDTEPVGKLWADGDRIAQLCDNLISNAVKFTPEGGRVHVRFGKAAGQVRLEVEDSGIGIPVREQSRLFERFYRATEAAERQVAGAGLGLWIAEAIVRMHAGTIDIESEVGAGTTFTVALPESTPEAGPTNGHSASARTPSTQSSSGAAPALRAARRDAGATSRQPPSSPP